MTPFTVILGAFLLALVLFGFAFWTPIYALPLAFLFLVGFGAFQLIRRRVPDRGVRDLREQAREGDLVDRVGFDERDRETLYESKRR